MVEHRLGLLPDTDEAPITVTRSIDRDQLQRLVTGGAQLVEVLAADEYTAEHLPDAIHLPLKSLTAYTASTLDRLRPVIVYCWDGL